jgi:hypothetical protein
VERTLARVLNELRGQLKDVWQLRQTLDRVFWLRQKNAGKPAASAVTKTYELLRGEAVGVDSGAEHRLSLLAEARSAAEAEGAEVAMDWDAMEKILRQPAWTPPPVPPGPARKDWDMVHGAIGDVLFVIAKAIEETR